MPNNGRQEGKFTILADSRDHSGLNANAYTLSSDKLNYELDNDPNGYQKQHDFLESQSGKDQGRTGPQMTGNLSGVQAQGLGQVAQSARSQQEMLAEALRGQAYGTGYNPAIAQLHASTQAAQGNQRSIAAGSMGYDGAAARREAAWGGAGLAAQAGGQERVLQAQQMAYGRDAYAQFSDALRGQDLATRDAMQQNGIRQAQIDDQTRAQNDAMAQFYLAEQDKLRRAQVGAHMGYQQQDAANKLGEQNRDLANHAYTQQVDSKNQATAVAGASGWAAASSKYATTPTDDATRKKRNPYDPEDY